MISAGFKKDMLIAIFCSSLLVVSNEDFDDGELINIATDEIDKEVALIANSIQEAFNKTPSNVKQWVHNKTRTVVPRALSKAYGTVNLELLAMYILFVHFIERDKPLSSHIGFLQEIDYMGIAERICDTEAGRVESEMFQLSYEIIASLRQ